MTASKVTIVIPTRERPDTLAKSLKTALNQDWPNLEVIVSDNCSGPATAEIVQSMKDPRITYLNTGRRLSMSHNWEFAISGIKEGWISLIGDDDGLLPNSLGRIVRLAEQHGVEALSSNTCSYNWPSRNAKDEAILTVPMGRGAKTVDAANALRRLMNWEIDGLVLPHLYTGGLISAALVDRMRAIRGTFFQSQIPDVYSGIAITSTIDKFVFSHEPFAINGASKHSNGAALFGLQKTDFLDEGNIPFHPDLPLPDFGTFTFSMPAMVCEAFLQSQHLRPETLQITPQGQLDLILNQTTTGRELLDTWALTFASRHGFDAAPILAASRRTSISRRLAVVKAPIKNLAERYRLDRSHGLELSDVFEASLAASTILAIRPGRIRSVARTATRLAKRMLAPGGRKEAPPAV